MSVPMTCERMGHEELVHLPVTVDLLTAARAFGLGRTAAYTLAKRGQFPCRVIRAVAATWCRAVTCCAASVSPSGRPEARDGCPGIGFQAVPMP